MARMRLHDDLADPTGGQDVGPLDGGMFGQKDNFQHLDYSQPAPPPFDYGAAIIGRNAISGREEFGSAGGGPTGVGPRRPSSGGNEGISPRRPAEPTPGAGSSETISSGGPAPSPGPLPFEPLEMPMTSKLAKPANGLYGSAGGLQGGGLGVPFDPTSDAQSNPIDTLMQLLMSAGKVR